METVRQIALVYFRRRERNLPLRFVQNHQDDNHLLRGSVQGRCRRIQRPGRRLWSGWDSTLEQERETRLFIWQFITKHPLCTVIKINLVTKIRSFKRPPKFYGEGW